jgi:hypothetical protein
MIIIIFRVGRSVIAGDGGAGKRGSAGERGWSARAATCPEGFPIAGDVGPKLQEGTLPQFGRTEAAEAAGLSEHARRRAR